MQATTIHFVRHGEVHNPDHILYERLPGFHLSDRGRRMAGRGHRPLPRRQPPDEHRGRHLLVATGSHS